MGGNNSFGTLLLLFAVGLLVITFMRGRRQQREAQTTQHQLAPGAEVMTTAGLYATVVAVEDSVVTLETAPGQRSRWDKRAVARIVAPAPGAMPGASPVQDRDADAENPPEGGGAARSDEPPPGRE